MNSQATVDHLQPAPSDAETAPRPPGSRHLPGDGRRIEKLDAARIAFMPITVQPAPPGRSASLTPRQVRRRYTGRGANEWNADQWHRLQMSATSAAGVPCGVSSGEVWQAGGLEMPAHRLGREGDAGGGAERRTPTNFQPYAMSHVLGGWSVACFRYRPLCGQVLPEIAAPAGWGRESSTRHVTVGARTGGDVLATRS